jgi:hypothetical protein
MFILLGMLAVAASDLLLLLERRDCGGLHEVHAHDGGRLQYIYIYITTHITALLLIYLECSLDRTMQRMPCTVTYS